MRERAATQKHELDIVREEGVLLIEVEQIK